MAIVAIGDGAAEGGEEKHRNAIGEPYYTEQESRSGEPVHQPALCHCLHPGPDQRDHLPAGEQSIVPVAESPEHDWITTHLAASATLASPGAASGYRCLAFRWASRFCQASR